MVEKKLKMNRVNFDIKQLNKAQERNYSTKLVSNLNLDQNEIDQRFKYYFSIPQPAQKSQQWLDQRTNYITASAFGNAISPRWTSHRNELLKNKVSRGQYNSFKGNEATRWGEKYEDVANAIYCYREGVTVEEFGLIPHPDFPFLGASTDGISSKLINLEIKCPFSRKIKPGEVKPIYWKQMQLQMAVLDLELSHFLECSFKEYPSEYDFWADFDYDGYDNKEKGIIIEYIDTQNTNLAGEPKTSYAYSPIELCENQDQMRIWYKQALNKMVSNPSQVYIRSHFWVLPVCSCVNVIRERDWFDAQIPKFVEFWDDVLQYREKGGMDQLVEDIEKNKPQKRKIKTDPGKFTLELSDLSSNLIMSSSDEEIVKEKNTKKPFQGCLMDSSDEEPNSKKASKLNGGCLMDSTDDEEIKKDRLSQKQIESDDSSPVILEEEPVSVKERVNQIEKLDQEDSNDSQKIVVKLVPKSKNLNNQTSNNNYVDKDNTNNKNRIKLTRNALDQIDNISNHSLYSQDDDESSGSDETGDSTPSRPPSRKVFYRRKKSSGSKK